MSMSGATSKADASGLRIGRYLLFDELARGGMASVHLGVMSGEAGFNRLVAIKRLHPHYSAEREFVAMFLDEARLASRIRHPNVVAPIDVVRSDGELFLVMELVLGHSLAELLNACKAHGQRLPLPVASRIMVDVLVGLHAAHQATNEQGLPLSIVHRDVSPQNVLVGADGVSRVLDFGIAKATTRLQTTREGQLKGKLRYMAPEQLADGDLTRASDVYAASAVLWEVLTNRRIHNARHEAAILAKILNEPISPPRQLLPDIPEAVDAIVMRGLSRDPARRFGTTQEMAEALETALPPAGSRVVAEWLSRYLGEQLSERQRRIAEVEGHLNSPAPSTSELPAPSVRHVTPVREVPRRLATPAWRESTHTLTVEGLAPPSAPSGDLERPLENPSKASLRRGVWVGAGVALAALVTVAGSYWLSRPAPPTALLRLAVPSQVSLTPEARFPAESPTVSFLPPESSVSPPTTAARAPAAAPRPKPRVRPVANCNPPWEQDKNGFRRVKRECL